MSVADEVHDYVQSRGRHRSGVMRGPQLRAIERAYRSPGISVETGCGATTILLSKLSRKHFVFCHDDRAQENSSLAFVLECPLFEASAVEFVFGPTQKTVPAFHFAEPIDLALIDGPHAFPFAEMEYYYFYTQLKPGAPLIVDDVNIPTLHNFYRFLREEPMFDFIEKADDTAIFRRTDAPTFDPFNDNWEYQNYNRNRFPAESRDERLARRFPKWLTHLVPKRLRAAARAYLFQSER